MVATNSWATRMADSVLQTYPATQWNWHYEHGLVVKAIWEAGLATGNLRYEQFVRDWVDHFVTPEGNIRTYCESDFNLDQINPGKLLFPIYQRTGETRYLRAIQRLWDQLKNQPRNPSGGFWHKQIYPDQMWLDGLYMAGPFIAEYAHTFKEPGILNDATRQLILIEQHVRDPKTGLLYHAWDESRQQRWANPETGCSPQFWGRAIGWYAMALVDVLNFLPVAHPDRPVLVGILSRLAQALLRFQDPATGLWFQVIDLPERPGNYCESSVSAMLIYAFARAVSREYIAPDFLTVARRSYRGLLENRIKIDGRGKLTLEGTCSVAGLGGDHDRDGSFEYYVGEKIADNDFKGVGPFILAALEMESAEGGHKP